MNQTYSLPPEILFQLHAPILREQLLAVDSLNSYFWNCEVNFEEPKSPFQIRTNPQLLYTTSEIEKMTGFVASTPQLPSQHFKSKNNNSILIQQADQVNSGFQNQQCFGATRMADGAHQQETNETSDEALRVVVRLDEREELKIADIDNGEQITPRHNQVRGNQHQSRSQPLSTILLQDTFRNQMIEKLFNAHFKQFYRQDEIYKKIIRRLVRAMRLKFKRFVMTREGRQVYDNMEAEHLLLIYLSENYNIAQPISNQQLEFAKSTVYTFGAKTREALSLQEQRLRVRELRNQFLEKGTQREAEKFFKSEVGFKLFYHDFAALLIFGNQRCNHHNNWKVIYGFKKLMKRLLCHQSFKDLLEQSVGNIYRYQDTFPEPYATSF